jgi:hypothetical protein
MMGLEDVDVCVDIDERIDSGVRCQWTGPYSRIWLPCDLYPSRTGGLFIIQCEPDHRIQRDMKP